MKYLFLLLFPFAVFANGSGQLGYEYCHACQCKQVKIISIESFPISVYCDRFSGDQKASCYKANTSALFPNQPQRFQIEKWHRVSQDSCPVQWYYVPVFLNLVDNMPLPVEAIQ